jgi:outer membrane protein OmpA-like peptidoglycan-associated protein
VIYLTGQQIIHDFPLAKLRQTGLAFCQIPGEDHRMWWLTLFMFGFIPIASAQSPAPMTMDICPDNYYSFPKEDGPTLVCGCPREALQRYKNAIGANPYARGSSPCYAALHAGVIDKQGGQVMVIPVNHSLFPGVERHGVSSTNAEPGSGFMVSGLQGEPAPHLTSTATGVTIDVCPWANYQIPLDTPPIICGCTPEAMKSVNHHVSGANPYAPPSDYCRAALHAGILNKQGGQVMVTQVEKAMYPGVTRNEVQSGNWEPGRGFRVDAVPGATPPPQQQAIVTPQPPPQPPPTNPGVDSAGRPIQAPIEQTLRSLGYVQVYINFVTDSAQLLPSSNPVLSELLKTLTQNPSMQIALIGHTDSTGTAPHNQDLSERRAASVYLWLVQHGIPRERLRSSGRGYLEPIATNDTVEGRALNRRVEVKAVQ